MTEFITIEVLRAGHKTLKIKDIQKQNVDGLPRLVVYFYDDDRCLLMTRQIADDLTAAFGHHPLVDEFFSLN